MTDTKQPLVAALGECLALAEDAARTHGTARRSTPPSTPPAPRSARMSESIRDQAVMMMSRIRYQIFTPDVTTMGACPRCGKSSRGGGVCAKCIGRDLDALLGLVPGDLCRGTCYAIACADQRRAEDAVLAIAEGADE